MKEASNEQTIMIWGRPVRAQRVVVHFIFALLFFVCAITAGLPDTLPYKPLDSPAEAGLDTGDTAFVIISSALVLLMTPGVAFFYSGGVDSKNVLSTVFQSLIAMGLVSILWVVIGFSLAFGRDANDCGIIGYPKTFYLFNNVGAAPDSSLSPTTPLTIFSMFQLMFAIITPTLISGSLAERVNFNSWCVFICIWHLLVYCPLAHIVWHPDGVLRKWGYLDFAGGIPVEMASGYASLAGAIFIGPRRYRDALPQTSQINVILGTSLFWFGWLGFNAGSALSSGGLACQAFATTNTAGAAGMLAWIMMDMYRLRPKSVIGACNGIICGLVAITPACGYVTVGASMVIGAVSTIICYIISHLMKDSGVDDTLDVFSVHGIAGTCGVFFTGFFCSLNVNPAGADGLVYGSGMQLGKHIAVIVVAIPCIMISSYGCFWLTDKIIPLRATTEEEDLGLDMSYHGETISINSSTHGAPEKTAPQTDVFHEGDVQMVFASVPAVV